MHLFSILYVKSVPDSVAFYRSILGASPVEEHPTFASFALGQDHFLGLWVATGVQPAPQGTGSNSEICLDVADASVLEAKFQSWREAGARVLQEPTAMDFGLTCTVADPDGHRLRLMVSPRG